METVKEEVRRILDLLPADATWIRNMKRSKLNAKRFVVCIDNSDYPASLELHKIYQVLPDRRAAVDNYLRVVDESGEDYLYSARRFVPVELPQRVERSVSRATKESTMHSNKAIPPARSGSLTRASASPRTQRRRARHGLSRQSSRAMNSSELPIFGRGNTGKSTFWRIHKKSV